MHTTLSNLIVGAAGCCSMVSAAADMNTPDSNQKITKALELLQRLPKSQEAPLAINSLDREAMPRHFRSTTDALIMPAVLALKGETTLPSRMGLDDLHASASAQPTEGEFTTLGSYFRDQGVKATVINLREESCALINGHAVSVFAATNFGNMGKSTRQILEEEAALIKSTLENEKVTVFKILSKTSLECTDANTIPPDSLGKSEAVEWRIDTIATEEEAVVRAGLSYVRLPMTDHMRPNDQAVNAFVDELRNREVHGHVHFHCWEGHGRTTTVMIMLDAMHHAGIVSFDDICKRQWALGGQGSDMSNVPAKPNYKHELFDERYQFLKNFYQYCLENRESGYQKSWTLFLQEKGLYRWLST